MSVVFLSFRGRNVLLLFLIIGAFFNYETVFFIIIGRWIGWIVILLAIIMRLWLSFIAGLDFEPNFAGCLPLLLERVSGLIENFSFGIFWCESPISISFSCASNTFLHTKVWYCFIDHMGAFYGSPFLPWDLGLLDSVSPSRSESKPLRKTQTLKIKLSTASPMRFLLRLRCDLTLPMNESKFSERCFLSHCSAGSWSVRLTNLLIRAVIGSALLPHTVWIVLFTLRCAVFVSAWDVSIDGHCRAYSGSADGE